MAIPENLIQGIGNLDPLPVTIRQLMSSMSGEDYALSEVAKIVEYDQAVMANILRVANSAYFSGRNRIETVQAAIVRIGTSSLMNIVLGQYLRGLTVDTPLYDLTEDDLWIHSVAASLAAEEIMKVTAMQVTKNAPVAALLHDVGKLVMVRYFEGDFRPVLALCEENDCTYFEAERQLFGCDHAEVGGAVARNWGFPEEVTLAIEKHHLAGNGEAHPALDTVVLSNLVAKTLAVGLGAEGMNLSVDSQCPKRLGIDFDGFCLICTSVAERLDELRGNFSVFKGSD
jgi:putative nucleotidyltransferase with HDIG domain